MKKATLVAAAVVAVSAGSLIAASLLDLRVPAAHRERIETEVAWTAGIAGLGLAVPGALLLRRLPRHPIGWLLCLSGLHWCLDAAAGTWLAYSTWHGLPGGSAAFWIYQRFGAALMVWLPLLLLIYPSGRLPGGRARIAAWASLVAAGLMPLLSLVVPAAAAQQRAGSPMPAAFAGLNLDPASIPLPDGWWAPIFQASFVALPLGMIVPVAVVVSRYRQAAGDDRLRMRWLLWAAVIDLLVFGSVLILPELSSVALAPAVGLTGAAVVVAITRPTLLDVDRLLGGTVLYAAMAATVLAVDACVLGVTGLLLGRSLPERDAAVVAMLLVTAGYGPLRHRLWLLVRRLVLGRRDDPYRVVAGLAEQLERSSSPEDELLAVAVAVADAFRSPYVIVEVDRPGGEKVVATQGVPAGPSTTLPISYRGETVGRVVLPAGGPRVSLSRRDERLLADVVRQAAIAARNAHLVRELQRGRELIVAAREEERRRLRRDLHDGLGPALGGVALRIDTARNLAARRPEEADRLLKQAREDATAAVADVRRLVHDAAARLADQFARGLRGRTAPAPRAALAVCRALMCEAAGDHSRSAAAFDRAARAWSALPRPYDAMRARERQAEALIALGRIGPGRELLAGQYEQLFRLGARGDADRVAQRLREHGAEVPRLWRGGRRGYGDQ
ncbi:histidine kinase, partial [Actinoplanes philippinensis]|uniref:histidine kinase n=1 Tax=Actinoplanes philippinensis TaxID=35752 RepID=UPI0033E849A6